MTTPATKKLHDKYRAQGLTPVTVWVPIEKKEVLKQVAKKLCEDYEPKKT